MLLAVVDKKSIEEPILKNQDSEQMLIVSHRISDREYGVGKYPRKSDRASQS